MTLESKKDHTLSSQEAHQRASARRRLAGVYLRDAQRMENSLRTRALIETKSFLQELRDPKLTPRVPAAVREIARRLLRHYQSYADVELAHKALPLFYGPVPGLQMGKSVLRVTTVAAARALMTQDIVSGHRETPDVGTPRVKVTLHAPKVAAFLERRNMLQSRERKE